MTAAVDERECEFLVDHDRLEQKKRALRGENVLPIESARAAKAQKRATELEEDEPLDERDPYSTLLTPGIYILAFVGADKVKLFGRQVWMLDFKVVSTGEGFGLPIRAFVSALRKGQKLTPSHGLVQLYVAATWRRPPRHLYLRSPAEFLRGGFFEGRVRTVTKDRRNQERPAPLHYSRVDALMRRLSDDLGSGAGT